MGEERTQRHLAAILAADVVGYSRLMEQDEASTFERLRSHRNELFEPQIAKHRGRIFKLMGDGLLAEFGSVVDAVECAVQLQRGMAERNSSLADDRRIDVRIGINLGDVIVEAEDRHGDGVNIAARLQQLAEPGGICISGTVFDQVRAKLAFPYQFVGEQRVKNIAQPIRIYRVPLAAGARLRLPRPRQQRVATAAIVGLLLIAVVAAFAIRWLEPGADWWPAISLHIRAIFQPRANTTSEPVSSAAVRAATRWTQTCCTRSALLLAVVTIRQRHSNCSKRRSRNSERAARRVAPRGSSFH